MVMFLRGESTEIDSCLSSVLYFTHALFNLPWLWLVLGKHYGRCVHSSKSSAPFRMNWSRFVTMPDDAEGVPGRTASEPSQSPHISDTSETGEDRKSTRLNSSH